MSARWTFELYVRLMAAAMAHPGRQLTKHCTHLSLLVGSFSERACLERVLYNWPRHDTSIIPPEMHALHSDLVTAHKAGDVEARGALLKPLGEFLETQRDKLTADFIANLPDLIRTYREEAIKLMDVQDAARDAKRDAKQAAGGAPAAKRARLGEEEDGADDDDSAFAKKKGKKKGRPKKSARKPYDDSDEEEEDSDGESFMNALEASISPPPGGGDGDGDDDGDVEIMEEPAAAGVGIIADAGAGAGKATRESLEEKIHEHEEEITCILEHLNEPIAAEGDMTPAEIADERFQTSVAPALQAIGVNTSKLAVTTMTSALVFRLEKEGRVEAALVAADMMFETAKMLRTIMRHKAAISDARQQLARLPKPPKN